MTPRLFTPKAKRALAATLRREPSLVPLVTKRLVGGMDEESAEFIGQAAQALAPVLERAVESRSTKLGAWGLKGARALSEALGAADGRLGPIAHAKTIGILFVDISGFTAFTARHGDAGAVELVAEVSARVNRAVRLGKGVTVKRLGDGFLLAFPSASQAVRAGISLSRSVRGLEVEGEAVRLRIAVHAGNPRIERGDLLGHDVNLAAHLLDHCRPGEVLVSREARTKAGRRLRSVRYSPERRVAVRGVDGEVAVCLAAPA